MNITYGLYDNKQPVIEKATLSSPLNGDSVCFLDKLMLSNVDI